MPSLSQYEALRDWLHWQNEPEPFPFGWYAMVKDMKSYAKYDEYLGALLDEVLVTVFGVDYEQAHDWTFDSTLAWVNTQIANKELEDAETNN